MRTVAELMTRSPIVIDCHQSLAEAEVRMTQFKLRHLPVIGVKGLVGMLSERDVYRFERTKPNVDRETIAVGEAMSPDPYTVSPDAPVDEVARAMAERSIGAAVVMEGTRIAGVFTTTDALHALAGGSREGVFASPKRLGRPKKILCPVDFSRGSREAVSVALEQARASGGSVTLFHACELPRLLDSDALQLNAAARVSLHAEIDASLREWQHEYEGSGGPQVSIARGVGSPWRTITRHAADHGFDLIVIGTHGRTGLARAILGSVAESVVRHAHCPVLVVRSENHDAVREA